MEDVDQPSCMVVSGDMLFVGQYSDKVLAVVDLSTYRVIETIPLAGSPCDLISIDQDD